MNNLTNQQITEFIKAFLLKVLEEKGHDAYIQAHKAILAGDYQASLIACPIPEWANKFKGQAYVIHIHILISNKNK